ncbi:MAG: serine hydrolase domain-containing protein [Wenzhouxiangella sp.]|nr:serine hydrolase domain-containing protein [Wenzhouxiangella sp.]
MRVTQLACLLLTLACALAAAPLAAERSATADPLTPPELSWAVLEQQNVLTWSQAQMRVGFPNIDQISPVRRILASQTPKPLPVALWPATQSWADDMDALHLTGLLVIEDGVIRYEQYRQGHTAEQPWMSFSVTKSVVSMLYGAALKDGFIQSLDQTVSAYLPQFDNTAYAEVTLRDLLRMQSGVAWREVYDDPNSDVSRLDNAKEADILAHLASLPRAHPPGTTFNYNTGETTLAGVILARAVGQSLSAYLADTIWQPYGMASPAHWALMGTDGGEMGGCCISATLTDYGRLGLMALNNWRGDGAEDPLPAGWLRQATTPSPNAPHYGYFWWLEDGNDFRAAGIFGQAIHISPESNLVIAMHGAWPSAVDEALADKRRALIAEIKAKASRAR